MERVNQLHFLCGFEHGTLIWIRSAYRHTGPRPAKPPHRETEYMNVLDHMHRALHQKMLASPGASIHEVQHRRSAIPVVRPVRPSW